MKAYSLTLGSRNRPRHGRRFSREDARVVQRITQQHFPEGFTILEADGGWFDPARKHFVREESRQILVCTSDARRLKRWCHDLARALRQDELLVIELGPARRYRRRRQV